MLLQVVSAANIIGAGHGLEVGRRLELLSIRQAEAEAEQSLRLHRNGPRTFPRSTADPASLLASVAKQVGLRLLRNSDCAWCVRLQCNFPAGWLYV